MAKEVPPWCNAELLTTANLQTKAMSRHVDKCELFSFAASYYWHATCHTEYRTTLMNPIREHA